MKEIGILYSTPMILAKLAGRKTVTRRPISPQPIDNREVDGSFFEGNYKGYVKVDGHPDWQKQFAHEFAKWQPGDILYCREKWYAVEREHQGIGVQFIIFEDELNNGDIKEDAPLRPSERLFRWGSHPSIHLPKYASRIWERVISVFPERLGDITEEDAVREGILKIDFGLQTPAGSASIDGGKTFHPFKPQRVYGYSYDPDAKQENTLQTARSAFINLWQSIHGPESWNPDTWVWRLETEILSTTGRPANL